MIRVLVELWPHGDRSQARTLREMVIGNMGGVGHAADYRVELSMPDAGFTDPSNPLPEEVTAVATVRGHDRRRDVLPLVTEALKAVLREAGR